MNEPSIVAIHQADHSVLAVGHEAKAMLGRTPGQHHGDPAAQGRRHRRLRRDREDAALLHQQGAPAPDPRAPAHRHRRAVGDHPGREARGARLGHAGGRARGLPDRGADGGGDRGGPAHPGAGRQHDRGHRRRHHRGGGHLALRHRLLQVGAHRRRRDGRGDRAVHQEALQPARRRAARRGDQDQARLGLPHGRRAR